MKTTAPNIKQVGELSMNQNSKKKLRTFMIVYGTLLFLLVGYVLLDVFVIPRTYSTVTPTPSNGDNTAKAEASITENSYQSNNIDITIETYREYDTTIYVADVKVSNADNLKTAFANNVYGRNMNQKTSEIASENQAILAINGDFYGTQQDGYVIRNGVLYRDKIRSTEQEDLVIGKDGSFQIIQEGDTSSDTLMQEGVLQVLSFGPGLIIDGKISVDENDEVGKAMASNPRTAIAQIEPFHYLFVVSDGRTSESEGLSLYQLAEFLSKHNVTCAYNLDGGGSSTMYFNNKIINKPTTRGNDIHERRVSDIVFIGE